MLLWRVDLAKHEQEQHIVEAIETATYYKWPSEARKPEQIARKDWTCRPSNASGRRCDACCCRALRRGDNRHYIRRTRRHIHLREGASYQQQRYYDSERRREGDQHQADIRWKVSE